MFDTDTVTQYFSWENYACRLHKDAEGRMKADLYRAGKGEVSINPGELLCNAREIGEEEYKQIVLETIELSRQKEQS